MGSFNSRFSIYTCISSSKAAAAFLLVLGMFVICSPLLSQGNFGRILGTVTDQSGGVVAGATVTILDVDRGVSRTLTSDDAGEYNAPNLQPGRYSVRAEAKGFKTVERQNVILEVGKEPRVDLTLQPGEQTQTVTVTESIPLVETTNATMGGTLNNTDIIDLPLNGRDYQNLLGLRPGVMLQPGGGPWTQSTNGVRPDESVWLIDGVINANFFDARPVINMPSPFTDGATILPVDAIQEFNLMENPKAEYGWKAGAIVNVGIKSGTNNLHGDAYAFGRYQGWDARNYFNIAAQNGVCALNANVVSVCDQTPAQLKQFGGTVGGPIKKDKLFFFAGYEGLRSFIGFVGGLSVPATQSVGDASKSMVDAIKALQAAAVPVSAVSLKLAGCTAGASPACTGGLFPNTGTSTSFLSTFPTSNQSDNGVAKIDYHPNDKSTINGMFFLGNYTAIGEDHPFAQIQSTDTAPIRSWSDTVSWVYTPSSSVVNEMRFGYNRVSFDFVNIDVNTPASTYGINTGITNPLAGGLPSITISGFGNGGTPVVGTAFNRPQYFSPNPYYDFQDSVSILRGKHAFKFGGEFTHMEADAQVFNNGRGRFDFNGGVAIPGASTSLEDFFAGTPTDGVLLTGTPQSKLTFMNFAGFVQDDWRVTPKVIVNMGLRYMYLTPMKDANNNLGNFDPTSATGIVQQGQVGWNTIYKADTHDLEPRIGLAWDVRGNGRTVVRMGVGLVHETWSLETFEGQFGMQNDGSTAINAIPTAASISCGIAGLVPSISCPSSGGGTNALGSATFAPSTLCWDPAAPVAGSACGGGQKTVFPAATGGPKCGDGVGTASSPCDLMGVDPNLKLPYVVTYNLSVQHQLGSNFSVEVAYVGNHGYNLLNFADINQAPLGAAYCLNSPLTAAQLADVCGSGPATARVPLACIATASCAGSGQAVQEARPFFAKFPYLGFINFASNRAYSNYNSAQITLTKRMSQGLSFTAGYTYAHALDNGSLNRFGLNPQDSGNLAGEYGSSDFDIRHRVTFTVSYNIPGKKGFGQMLEGWQINSIVNYATAQPWQTFDNSDNFSGTGEKADRWNIFGNAADFPSGKNSIPYCSGFGTAGATCGFADPYNAGNNTDPLPAAFVSSALSGCAAHAASPATLASAGCYVSTNGNSFITPPALGSFGNMGRNILRDSGYHNWDLSIFKNFRVTERFGAQLRWEVFNVLNIPIAANPSGASSFVNTGNTPGPGAVFGASFLTPDFAAGNPLIGSGSQRVMQLGLKLTF